MVVPPKQDNVERDIRIGVQMRAPLHAVEFGITVQRT
jgi:hypothetical protein